MKITVFGSGSWGTAIAILLCDNNHEVTLWSHNPNSAAKMNETRNNPRLAGATLPDELTITADLTLACAGIEIAVIATPSFAIGDTAEALNPLLPRNCIVVCMSKGIEKGSSKLFTQVLREKLGAERRIAALSGPTHAEEVALRVPMAAVAASEDVETAALLQDVFMNENFRVYTGHDVIGVELGAALKNVIALCAGICDGLGFGDSTIAMLATRGLVEIANLIQALGGQRETVAGLAGLGDLIVTCTSRHSRNRRAGVFIGKGMTVEEAMNEVGAVVEGYYAAGAAHTLAESVGVTMPICSEAYRVLYENKDPRAALRDLMTRTKRHETELSFIV